MVAFERESGVPVVAITDEPPEKLDAFFAKYNSPSHCRRGRVAASLPGLWGQWDTDLVLTDVTNKVQSIARGSD